MPKHAHFAGAEIASDFSSFELRDVLCIAQLATWLHGYRGYCVCQQTWLLRRASATTKARSSESLITGYFVAALGLVPSSL